MNGKTEVHYWSSGIEPYLYYNLYFIDLLSIIENIHAKMCHNEHDTSEQKIIIRLNVHEQYSTVASSQRNNNSTLYALL